MTTLEAIVYVTLGVLACIAACSWATAFRRRGEASADAVVAVTEAQVKGQLEFEREKAIREQAARD